MVTRKLYKAGNSIVVARPSYMLEELHFSEGDTIEVWAAYKSKQIWLRHHNPNKHNELGNKPRSSNSSNP